MLFDVGVLEVSATESSGTNTLASGKYVAAQPRAVSNSTTRKSLARRSTPSSPLTDDVDPVPVGEPARAYVVRVHEDDAAALLDPAVAVVQAVDRGVELVVAAHRLQQQPPLGDLQHLELVGGEDRLARTRCRSGARHAADAAARSRSPARTRALKSSKPGTTASILSRISS